MKNFENSTFFEYYEENGFEGQGIVPNFFYLLWIKDPVFATS